MNSIKHLFLFLISYIYCQTNSSGNFLTLEEYLKKKEKLINLNHSTFESFTSKRDFTLLYFHSYEFKLCQQLIDDIIFATDFFFTLNTEYVPNLLASVDVSDYNNTLNITRKFPIEILPYIVLYSGKYKKFLPYIGELRANSIITFFLKNSGPLIHKLENEMNIKTFLDSKVNNLAVIKLKDKDNEKFENVSKLFKFALFATCYSEDCKKYFKSDSDYILFKGFEESVNKQFQPFNEIDNNIISNILYQNAFKRVNYANNFSFQIIINMALTTINYIIKPNDTIDYIEDLFTPIINDNKINKKDIIYGLYFDYRDYQHRLLINLFGFEEEQFNETGLVFIVKFENGTDVVYKMQNKNINNETIKQFILDYNDNKIKPEMKSEALPKKPYSENFYKIVGKNFHKLIMENNEQGFLLYMKPSDCYNCSEINKMFEGLAKVNIENYDILFGVVDPLINDIPDIDINKLSGHPSFRYYYKNKKLPFVDYNEKEINIDSIQKWVKSINDAQLKMKIKLSKIHEYKEENKKKENKKEENKKEENKKENKKEENKKEENKKEEIKNEEMKDL